VWSTLRSNEVESINDLLTMAADTVPAPQAGVCLIIA
jgi:hypothetical protein